MSVNNFIICMRTNTCAINRHAFLPLFKTSVKYLGESTVQTALIAINYSVKPKIVENTTNFTCQSTISSYADVKTHAQSTDMLSYL